MRPTAPRRETAARQADPGGDPAAELIETWRRAVADRHPRVALADGQDPRALRAAARLRAAGTLHPLVLGRWEAVSAAAIAHEVALPADAILDTGELSARADVREVLHESFAGRSRQQRREAEEDPVRLAAAAVRAGVADAAVAGATRPTADVLRAGLRVLGLRAGVRTLSSSFVMVLPDGRALTYADCAVLPDPNEDQLADVAASAAGTHRTLVGGDPVVAMLSFSTRGSAEHPTVQRVRTATDAVRQRLPDVLVDGELQFDAAVVDTVSAHKAPGSDVAGRANVLVFPSLDAGNIGYKITERIGGALALGPILQGLAFPLNDLSRGCTDVDIEVLALASAVQSLGS